MKKLIPHNKPTLGKEEISAIEEVIKIGWIVEGKKVEKFEDVFCKYIGLPLHHAVALSNGTSALYLALKVLGVENGDEVIAPTYVCSAVLNAIYMAGARPILVDVDKTDFNISYQDIIGKINNETKAIILPHTFGVPADIIQIIENLSIPVIEDCAVALGSKIENQHVGILGDIGIFSFYASKVITTGQGGMLVSKNPENVKKARAYREFDCQKVYYPRFNFQMTDVQAAMGLQQLRKLNVFLNNRREIAGYYIDICKNKGWNFQRAKNSHYFQNWYRFVLQLENNKIVEKLRFHLKRHGIETIIPIENWELLHNYLKFDSKAFKNAEEIAQNTLSLPIYPKLVDDDSLEVVLMSLKEF